MGCGGSRAAANVAGNDLRLPNAKLTFSVAQLKALNRRLTDLGDDLATPLLSDDAESIAERLIQGLICGAAAKDPRFKSKFIVVLHKDRICKSNSLEYLILLDELDGCCAFGEGPPGCARIRPDERALRDWQEFVTPSGFLRRDKVIERWVEILAASAADGVIGNVPGFDDQYSTAPGHLVSPIVLQSLRKITPQEQCFYGNVREGGQFPSSRDYRIAIVEGNPWIRVRLAGGALGGGTEAKLALGIAFHGWPAGCDFPSRVPLAHSDAFVCYKAGQTGFFVVGGGPAPGVQWSERAAGWQVWTSAARLMLSSRGEGFARIGRVCGATLDHLRATGQPPLRAVSRFMVEETLLWRAEKTSSRTPAGNLRSWSSNHLAHQVLMTYDTLLGSIKKRSGRHYFFPGCDMIKMAVWRGARIGEKDWRGDVECLAGFIKKLHEESSLNAIKNVNALPTTREKLESALCCRWGLLMQELTPAGSTKSRRLAGAPTYSPRQISYVAATSRELLTARQLVIQESNEWYQGSITTFMNQFQDPIEDLIHLLAIILDQARDYFIEINFGNAETKQSSKDAGGASFETTEDGGDSKNSSKKLKLKNCFDASATCFIDSVRRDSNMQREDLSHDSILIRVLLKCLYQSIDEDKKYLSTVLKPYLDLLFATSHENCWHMEEVKKRVSVKELESLKSFSKLVGEGQMNPGDGVLDATAKGWLWAEEILDTLDTVSYINYSALRMLFTAPDGKVLKYDMSLPNDPEERENWNLFHANRFEGHASKLKLAEKCVVEAFTYCLDPDISNLQFLPIGAKSEEAINQRGSRTNTLKSLDETIVSEFDNSTKYHTLRSIDSKYNTLRNSETLFGSSWSNCNTIKLKDKIKPPVVLEKLNSVGADPDQENDNEDIDYSMHCNLRDLSPMSATISVGSQLAPHREYIGVIKALINMQKYSILQELAGWLNDTGEKTGTLKALHRLARAGRRASGPAISSSMQPSVQRHVYTLSTKNLKSRNKQRASIKQYYRKRNIDALSGDESNKNKKHDKKSSAHEQNNVVSPRTSELLDVEAQKEYIEKSKSVYDDVQQMSDINERYMELCREAIRDSQARSHKSSFSKFDKELKNKTVLRKDSHRRSSTVGRQTGKDIISSHVLKEDATSFTLGHNSINEIHISSTSLLGTCRNSRIHQTGRKSILPNRSSSTGNGLIGDAFKVSPVHFAIQNEYDLMTQSILQTSKQPIVNRQRQLINTKDKSFLLHT